MEDPTQLNDEVAALPAGREVTLGIWRAGEHRDLKVTLGDRSQAGTNSTGRDDLAEPAEGKFGLYGLKLTELTDKLRSQLGYRRSTQGVVVEEVAENSPAAAVGLEPGDLIYRINRQPIANPKQATEAFTQATDGASLVHVARGGMTAQLILEAK